MLRVCGAPVSLAAGFSAGAAGSVNRNSVPVRVPGTGGIEVHRAAMLLDDGAAQAQAQAHAFAARGEEGREQPRAEFAVDARPGVGDIEGDPAFVGLAHADAQHARGRVAAVLHGLDGVARQVQQHLLDHGAVAEHARRGLRQVGHHLRAALARLQAHQRQHRVEQQVDAEALAQLLAAAHEVVHALDHAAGALGLLGHALHRLAQHAPACRHRAASIRLSEPLA